MPRGAPRPRRDEGEKLGRTLRAPHPAAAAAPARCGPPPATKGAGLGTAERAWRKPPQQQPLVPHGKVWGYRAGLTSRRHHFGHGGPTAGSVPRPSPRHLCVRTPARRNNAARPRSARGRPRQPRSRGTPAPAPPPPGTGAPKVLASAPGSDGEVAGSAASGANAPRCITAERNGTASRG